MMIPLIAVPLVNVVITYFCMSVGLVGRVVGAIVPWTLPGPLGAYLACGGDWRAAVLNVVLILVGIAIYYPFFKMWEKSVLEQESEEDAALEA